MPKTPQKKIAGKTGPGWTESQVLKIARPSIQDLKLYVPGKSIEEVRAAFNPPLITKLGSNENPLGASPKVIAALKSALVGVQLYPDGSALELRRALAETHGLAPEQVIVGNGSDEVLLLITAAFLNPGEPVLVSENTFSQYEFAGRTLDGKVVKVPLKDFRYDLAGFRRRLRPRPKLIFLCNPNNPTGSYFSHEELQDLLRATAKETLVVVDEAYVEYVTAPDFPRSLKLLAEHPNLIISRTFSKVFGMAGVRLGYALAHPLIIRELTRVKTPFNVNVLAQKAALAALSDRAYVKKSLANNARGRRFLEGALRSLGLEFIPTQGNFMCFRTGRPAVELCEDLLRQGMIIRPLRSFGMDDWNRVTIGTPEQNRRFIAALKSVLK